MTNPVATRTIGKLRRPGFLLEPLRWVQARLSQAIAAEPSLVELLFDLDHARMHLMALALAHMSGDVPPDLALILLQGPRKTVLNLSLGYRPVQRIGNIESHAIVGGLHHHCGASGKA
jgi:hypothetical protein